MPRLDIKVLGSLQVARDGKPIDLPPRTARLLVLLVVGADTGLSDGRLIDELWRDPPPTAADGLRVRVHELRRQLGAADRITRIAGGYRLRLADHELDVARFATLTSKDAWRAAERLWRGPAFNAFTDSKLVHDAALRLDEQRIDVIERRIAAELDSGHNHLVSELRALTMQYPLREELWERLMLALYREGQQAEALRAYQKARRKLANELGINPGPALRSMERRILTQDPSLLATRTDRRTTPAQLPRDTPLVGRESEVRRLVDALCHPDTTPIDTTPIDTTPIGTAPIVTISGAGGVGKSTLAAHVCRSVAFRYPDGQLYVNLRGSTPSAASRSTTKILDRMLRALGAPGEAGADEAGYVERFRSITRDRRILVLLDNAVNAHQVAPLIPDGPGCAAVITTRRSVTAALPVTTHLVLEVLSPAASLDVIAGEIGASRVVAEPDQARRLVSLCGGLPLALRIVGRHLAGHPGRSLADCADRLVATRRDLRHGPAEQEALSHLREGLTVLRASNDRYLQARAHWGLAVAHANLGEHGASFTNYQQSLDLLVELGLIDGGQAQAVLSDPRSIRTILPNFVVAARKAPSGESNPWDARETSGRL